MPNSRDVTLGSAAAEAQSYRWEDWTLLLPEPERGRDNGRTHGVAVTEAGQVVVFRQADPAVLVFDADGTLLDAWGDRFLGAHGLTLVQEDAQDVLWLTDQDSGEVVKTTLSGETLLQLDKPSLAAYDTGTYAPTGVAVFEQRLGGDGSVWVADGYGMNYVHRYDAAGRYLGSIDGEEGSARPFDCPHGVWFDDRRAEPELYVADRGNHRLQVYDPEGRFKRSVAADVLGCPCAAVVQGDELVVAELCARLAVLDLDDRLVRYIGQNEAVCERSDWPNVPAPQLRPGAFNSPHAIAADVDGSLYVVEWIVGGRLTKLAKG